jgi:S-layer homology domain
MTNSSPPEPPTPRSRGLRRDEQVAVMVAFAAIGAIVWWALRSAPQSFNLFDLNAWLNPVITNNTSDPPATDGTSSTAPGTQAGEASDPNTAGTPATDGSIGGIVPIPIPLPNGDTANTGDATPGSTPSGNTAASPTANPTPIPAPEIPLNPNLPEPSPSERITFADVPVDYWALPFINGLSERQVVSGLETKQDDGSSVVNYEPERPVTRAEFAAQLQKVFALPNRQEAKKFTDFPSDYWAAPAITDSNQGGYMNGYPDGNFLPDRPIPRLELLVALTTGLQLPLPPNADAILQVYEDAAQIPNWAKPKIAAATQAGLVASHPNPKLFNPSTAATRAEVAATLYQALVVGKEAQPIESEYLVKPEGSN